MGAVNAVAQNQGAASLPVGVVYSRTLPTQRHLLGFRNRQKNPGYAMLRQVVAGGENQQRTQ